MSRWYSRYIIFVLLLANCVGFLDRQILTLVFDPIKADLHIASDTVIGLLAGPAYAFFFSVVGVPMGFAVDRYSRTAILTGGVAFWSLMTAWCGLAGSVTQLFLARMGVGIGEATSAPLSQSMIGDATHRNKLPMAMSFISLAQVWGPGLAFLFSGAALRAVTHSHVLPGSLGDMSPWRQAFLLVCIPGLVLAPVAALTVRVPRPKRAPPTPDGQLANNLKNFWRSNKNFIPVYLLSVGCFTGGSVAVTAWMPTMFIRIYNWSPAEVGGTMGLLLLLSGTAGSLGSGALASWQMQRGNESAPLMNLTRLGLLNTVLAPIAPMMPTANLALAAMVPSLLLTHGWGCLSTALVQSVAPPAYRGRIGAIYLACGSFIGTVIGTTVIPLITDFAFADPAKVNLSIAIATAAFWFLGAIGYYFCRKGYRNALARVPLSSPASA